MAGSEKSVASHISQRYPSVIYIHCYSHIRNLCIMKCIKIEQVKSIFEYCRTISDFFNNFPKRFQLFENVLQNLRHKKTQKLVNFCKTRWMERINGVSVFLNCYVVTYKCLKKISDNKLYNGSTWNAESSLTTCGLYHHMERFPFIIALVICREILSYTKSLITSLQGWPLYL